MNFEITFNVLMVMIYLASSISSQVFLAMLPFMKDELGLANVLKRIKRNPVESCPLPPCKETCCYQCFHRPVIFCSFAWRWDRVVNNTAAVLESHFPLAQLIWVMLFFLMSLPDHCRQPKHLCFDAVSAYVCIYPTKKKAVNHQPPS